VAEMVKILENTYRLVNISLINEADVVVLTTNHSAFDVEFIQKHSKLIVDMRNMVKDASENVYKL